jgi:hypothetical protein
VGVIGNKDKGNEKWGSTTVEDLEMLLLMAAAVGSLIIRVVVHGEIGSGMHEHLCDVSFEPEQGQFFTEGT